MKAESAIMPSAPFELELNGDTADVVFFDNVREKPGDEERDSGYEYDTYRLTVPFRPGLEADIEGHIEAWIAAAKSAEYKTLAARVRAKRDALLLVSDKYMSLDRIGLEPPSGATFTDWLSFFRRLGEAITGPWAAYRKALRDLSEQPGFPYDVTFPERPEDD